MLLTIKRALAAGTATASLLLVPAPAHAVPMRVESCAVWLDTILGGGSCNSDTVPANEDHWVRAGVRFAQGASFRIRDTDTGQVVCGEHTAWNSSASHTCFGLYGQHYRVEVIGARVSAVGFVANY